MMTLPLFGDTALSVEFAPCIDCGGQQRDAGSNLTRCDDCGRAGWYVSPEDRAKSEAARAARRKGKR